MDEGNPQLEALGGRTTVRFAEAGGKTNLAFKTVVVQGSPEMAAALAGLAEGGSQSLDRFAECWKM